MALSTLIVVSLLGSAQAQSVGDAERVVEGGLRVYADNDHVTVITPSAATVVPIGEALVVDVAAAVDIVSAASVDILTQASPSAVEEERIEIDTGVAYAITNTLAVQGRVIASHEPDYDSIRLTAGGRVEVARRNATIEGAYTLAFDSVGNAVDDDFDESRTGHLLNISFTQILDGATYLDIVAELQRFDGYHANPYRLVPIIDPATTELTRVPEATPELRNSGAALVRVRRAFATPRRWFASVYYRGYFDDWDVGSHTAYAHALVPLSSDSLLLGVQGRFYWQSAADFYRATYLVEAPEHRTRDRTLGGMTTLHGAFTLRAGWFLGNVGVARFSFHDYPAQDGRTAVILSTGATVPF